MVEESGVKGIGSEGTVGESADEGTAESGGQKGGDSAGTQDTDSIKRSELPEEMRGKTSAEISSMWGAATRVLQSKNVETDSLNNRIAQLESQALEQGAPPAEPDPDADVDLKELMLDDPERAMDIMLNRRYSTTVNRLEKGIGETELIKASRSIGADFDEHEDAVRLILSQQSGPVTEGAVHGAYLMARGAASVQKDKAAAKLSLETPEPTPEVNESDLPGALTGLAKEIQLGSRMTEEEFLEFSTGELVVEVPGL